MKAKSFFGAFWAVVAALAAVSGCAEAPQQGNAGSSAAASSVSPRSRWTVTGHLHNLDASIDGNAGTAAVSDESYAAAQITIDMGKPCLFNMVAVDHGRRQMGFPRRMAVLTSMDGESFTHRLSVPGTRRVTTACLLTPVLARYVRLQVEIPGDEPWSVAGVSIQ